MFRSKFTIAAWVLGVGLVSAGAWSSLSALAVSGRPAGEPAVTQSVAPAPVAASNRVLTQGFADVVARVTPAVVTIRTERAASARLTQLPDGLPFPFGEFFGQRAPRGRQVPAPLQRGLGSGVIVSPDGYILTNHHVVESSSRIQVELSDSRVLDATLVGADEPSDLAVLKIDGTDLPRVPFGDSTTMRVGDLVLAVGNPLGVGQTVTMGIVSAKGRATGLGDGSYEDFLQTDAPINQGNSGGALVNTAGELVGINSQILSPSGGNIGIGFAVPSNMAKNVMDQLVAHGRVQRGRLGVTVQTLTGDLAAGLGLEKTTGAIVSEVNAGSAADKAGLARGDVILAYEGRPVADSNTLRNAVAGTRPGSDVTLEVLRDGKARQFKATLDELTMARGEDGPADAGRAGAARFGMTIQPLTPEMANRLDLDRNARGVVITGVDPSGAAASAGLREGDVIEQVNGRRVESVDAVRSALEAATDRPAVLLITRGGASIFVPLRAQRG